MHGFTASETNCEFNFITISDELANFAKFSVKVVNADVGPEAHFLQVIAFLGFAGFAFFFGSEVAQLSIIQQPANRWVSVGRHFHQVKFVNARPGKSIGHCHNAQLFAILPYDPYSRDAYLLVDPVLPGYSDTSVVGLRLSYRRRQTGENGNRFDGLILAMAREPVNDSVVAGRGIH